MKRTLISITVASLIFLQGVTVFASPLDKAATFNSIPSNPVMTAIADSDELGSIEDFHELLNADDNVTAYCLDYENGYIIYDEYTVLEFSYSTSSPYEDSDECYYFGPLNYYEKEANKYVHIRTSQKIGFDEAEIASDVHESIKTNVDSQAGNFSSLSSDSDDEGYTIINHYQLQHSLSTLNYNTDNTCGSLALTIMMDYWHDYISGYSLKTTYANNPYSLYTYLKTHIEPDAGTDGYNGSSGQQLKDGYKAYSGNVLTSGSTNMSYDNTVSWGFVYSHITSNKPGILLIQNHPVYGNHWVITSGVYHLRLSNGTTLPYFEINDGWGNNDIVLPKTYTDGYLYIS